ncbi:MAG: dihydropteroate synthase [Phycisphaerae bacterium]
MNDTPASMIPDGDGAILPGLPMSPRPFIMGILNLTPESFSDGGRFFSGDGVDAPAAAAAALKMAQAGADIIDMGAEATSFHRDGVVPVAPAEQIRRLSDALKQSRRLLDDHGFGTVAISVDTRSSAVAGAALDSGAAMINDVSGGRHDPAMLALAAQARCPIILMHAWPESPDRPPQPRADIVSDLVNDLRQIKAAALAAGIGTEHLILDPGIGFGKAPEDNWQILRQLGDLAALGSPLAVGFSRKRITRDLLPPDRQDWQHRDIASAVLLAAVHHPSVLIYRVHDVFLTAVARAAVQRTKGPR